jgi:hypothetical protein
VTRPIKVYPDEMDASPIPILYGGDGYVTYCLACDRKVTPGHWPRSTVQAALYDRLIHQGEHTT